MTEAGGAEVDVDEGRGGEVGAGLWGGEERGEEEVQEGGG